MNLQQILAYADNVRRVMGRNVKDLVTDPENALSKTAANTLQTVQELPDSPSNFLGAGVTKSLRGPQHEAMRLAQQRAALPPEQHGLGLPPDNTPQMRADMMFPNESYHGSLYDITKPNLNKASTEAHAGQGFYSTSSPKDASMNYANINGPDVSAKVQRQFEQMVDGNYDGRDFRRIQSRLYDGELTPRQQEVVLANTVGADNLGVVYPLRTRADMPVHLDKPSTTQIPPLLEHDPHYDDWNSTGEYRKFEKALAEHTNSGGSPDKLHEFVADYGTDPIDPKQLYKTVEKDSSWLMDEHTGDPISPGTAAANFLRHFGADEITHRPQFRDPQLNIGDQHTISMNPDNVRSRFAAFDPWRRNAAIAAATGTLAPDLLAEELRKPQP